VRQQRAIYFHHFHFRYAHYFHFSLLFAAIDCAYFIDFLLAPPLFLRFFAFNFHAPFLSFIMLMLMLFAFADDYFAIHFFRR